MIFFMLRTGLSLKHGNVFLVKFAKQIKPFYDFLCLSSHGALEKGPNAKKMLQQFYIPHELQYSVR